VRDKLQNFRRFEPVLQSSIDPTEFLIGKDGAYSVSYTPFEHSNASARLALVGISPGPKQMNCAYRTAAALLARSVPPDAILATVKRNCAFIGMRNSINELLNHFNIPSLIGISDAATLWTNDFELFEPTSIIPNGAFRNGTPFAGPLKAVLRSPLLRAEFEENFIPSIRSLSGETLYVAMGPTVAEALHLCARHGVISTDQLIGCIPHTSGASGSQRKYFLGETAFEDLHPRDPVRNRVDDLDAARSQLIENVAKLEQLIDPGVVRPQ
jgi:hypothetical protein